MFETPVSEENEEEEEQKKTGEKNRQKYFCRSYFLFCFCWFFLLLKMFFPINLVHFLFITFFIWIKENN